MDPQEFARHLRKPDGEAGISIGKTMNEGNAKMHEHAFENLHLSDNDKILEIGFGNGSFIPEILGKAAHVEYSGIDISETMIEEARKLIDEKKLNNQAEVSLASISKIPFPEDYFDWILTLNTIYFWENPSSDIEELYRVLIKGGSLLICFRPKEMAEKLPVTQFGFKLYTLDDALALVKSGGFTQINYTYKEEPPADVFGNKISFSSYCLIAVK